jgi:2,4-dienoyl-CoA reductase-like NADH-dependent reductase (Old Yellow Enzyme family)
MMGYSTYENAPVPGLPYFTPLHSISPGTVKEYSESTPTIFRPLKIRGITLRNRICVSPMCHYSCAPSGPQTGVLTPLYFTTIGHYAFKGAALAMLEATGVCPAGRISVNCPGLYNDAQRDGLKALADFIHSQGGLIGVQLSHAGRKGSTQAPWVALRQGKSSARAEPQHGGWPEDVFGPSGGQDMSWDGKKDDDPAGGYWAPREMSQAEIGNLVSDFAKAAGRAVEAGIDAVEIHASHGYLLHQFISLISNHRIDTYGGSFDNRIRVVLEVIRAVRAAIPDTMPLFVRISATDWMEQTDLGKEMGSWDLSSTIRFAKLLPDLGVDVLDVSSAGNSPQAAYTVFNAGKQQAGMAKTVREELASSGEKHLLVGTVGEITSAKQAHDILQDVPEGAQADLISVGRAFLRDPGWVMKVAEEFGRGCGVANANRVSTDCQIRAKEVKVTPEVFSFCSLWKKEISCDSTGLLLDKICPASRSLPPPAHMNMTSSQHTLFRLYVSSFRALEFWTSWRIKSFRAANLPALYRKRESEWQRSDILHYQSIHIGRIDVQPTAMSTRHRKHDAGAPIQCKRPCSPLLPKSCT